MVHNQIILFTYKLLKKHSSASKRLSKSELSRLLKIEYGLRCDRKALSRALDVLSETLDDVRCTEKLRGEGGKAYTVKRDWYAQRVFTREETETIAESLLKNSEVSAELRETLLAKLADLGELPLDTSCISAAETECFEGREEDNLVTVIEAIKHGRMLSFPVVEFEYRGKQRLLRDDLGKVREYLVKPIDILAAEGRFYLFGELGDSEKYAYFLLREIYEPKITDVSFSLDFQYEKNYIPKSRAEAEFPIGGKRDKIVIALSRNLLREFNARFGGKAEIVKEYGEKIELAFECNINTALSFIMQFGDEAEVMSPSRLRRAVALTCKNTAGKYLASKQYRGHIV